ncbi:MAG: MBL fold metallo-hydrolase [Hyphomicrobiaceae bacterium]
MDFRALRPMQSIEAETECGVPQSRFARAPVRNRRRFLQGLAGIGLMHPLLGATRSTAVASSLKVGAFKVTTFSDGYLTLPATMAAPDRDAGERAAALEVSGVTMQSPLNVTLVETQQDRIVVDVGAGPHFMETAGRLAESLESTGVDPESITKVVYTHAHPDHIGGTVNDFDELSFPNAKYFVGAAEWDFWMSKDILENLPDDRVAFGVGAQRNLKAVEEKLSRVKPGDEIVSGMAVLDTAGHTPGHISLELGDARAAIIVIGDALLHPVISFRHPEWRPAMDHMPDEAVDTRKRLLAKLASEQQNVVGYHLPTPGLGRVMKKGTAYEFVPLR